MVVLNFIKGLNWIEWIVIFIVSNGCYLKEMIYKLRIYFFERCVYVILMKKDKFYYIFGVK